MRMKYFAVLSLMTLPFASADDSFYYRPLPKDMEVIVTLKTVTLPAYADAVTFLGIGSDDFKYRLAFDRKKNGPTVFLAENTSNATKSYPIEAKLILSAEKILNPFVAEHAYNSHAKDWWYTMVSKGRVCLLRVESGIKDQRACFDPVIVANKMIELGNSSSTFQIEDPLDDARGEGSTRFPTPMISRFQIELKRNLE